MGLWQRIFGQPEVLSEQDAICQGIIKDALFLKPHNARVVAEMARGRPLSDSEWAKVAPIWEKNWRSLGLPK